MEGWRTKDPGVSEPLVSLKGMECKTGLLQDDHLAQEGHIIRLQLVEIDTSCNPLTEFVATIPIGSTAPTGVVARPLMSEF